MKQLLIYLTTNVAPPADVSALLCTVSDMWQYESLFSVRNAFFGALYAAGAASSNRSRQVKKPPALNIWTDRMLIPIFHQEESHVEWCSL